MKRPIQPNQLVDRMHRGFVYTCLGLTAYGGYLLSLRVYRFFTVIQPETKAYQQQLLKHGGLKRDESAADNVPQLKA